jgi:paraquat-inducible protein A
MSSAATSKIPFRERARLLAAPTLLVSALLCFGFGIFFPFFTVTKFWVFRNAVSVTSGLITLYVEREYFLFGVLTLFTIIFPVVKLSLLGVIWLERKHKLSRVRQLHHYVVTAGKWSMLDVFVVAILLVAMKTAAVADIRISLGLYLFTFSVIFTQFATSWIDRLLRED